MLKESKTHSFNFKMILSSIEETKYAEFSAEGGLKTGTGNLVMINLKDNKSETITINNAAEQILYMPRENRYQQLPSAPTRHEVIASMIPGIWEIPCTFIADILEGNLPALNNMAVIQVTQGGKACWEVSGETDLYALRISLLKDEPCFPVKMTMALYSKAAKAYIPDSNKVFTIVTEFKNWQVNPANPDSVFIFSPPPNAVKLSS